MIETERLINCFHILTQKSKILKKSIPCGKTVSPVRLEIQNLKPEYKILTTWELEALKTQLQVMVISHIFSPPLYNF